MLHLVREGLPNLSKAFVKINSDYLKSLPCGLAVENICTHNSLPPPYMCSYQVQQYTSQMVNFSAKPVLSLLSHTWNAFT